MEGTNLRVTGSAWLNGVASDGVFYKKSSSTWQSGYTAIPSSWATRDWSEDPTDFVKVTSTPAFRYSCYVEGTSDYYQVGDIVTLKCTPINGYVFNGWYVNGTLVSTSDTYSFTATQNIEVTPSFGVCLITASANPSNGGTVSGAGTYNYGETASLTATANEGYTFVNWTEDGEEVSTEPTYSFVVTGERNLVANFVVSQTEQTVELSEGWSWWSTNLDITLNDLKNAIADAVGNTGTAAIKTQGGAITYRNGQWRGNSIQSLDIRRMYEIQTSVTCEITLVGTPVNPSEYEITITPDNNWIGFLSGTNMTLSEAFGTFPVNGDMITSKNLSSVYRNGQWRGQLKTLQPGNGYIYNSAATGNRTFVFPTSER